MEAEELFYALLKAEDEGDVEAILDREGFLVVNDTYWAPLGSIENNFSTVSNQHADPTGALVDKIVNGIDAVLMSGCFAQGIEPEDSSAPNSMSQAVERFFGVRAGRLDSLSSRQRSQLAELTNLRLVAVGSKTDPCYLLIDQGEGQTPANFPNTFLSLHQSNKLPIPFVQGMFNSGGTGILQFCGSKNYQLIASRRNPAAPTDNGDSTADLWGFTVVRRLPPARGVRSSVYVYLAPQGQVLTFRSHGINVIPGDEERPNKPPLPYQHPLEHGTCIKLYNYRWPAKSSATTHAYYALQQYLHSPCLPIRVTETRDYRAHSYSATVSGVWATVTPGDTSGDRVEPRFPADSVLTISGIGSLPYRVLVFKENEVAGRVPGGICFTINGQVHGRLSADFTRSRLKFEYLSRHLLVSVDCTQMEPTAREDFFMASRDRFRNTETYQKLVELLENELRDHSGLRAVNAARRKKELEKALDDERSTADVFQHILTIDPTLSGLLSQGIQLVTSTGPAEPPLYKGNRFPTYFRIAREPKQGLVKHCPINRTIQVEFETDAENDYFTRPDSPGSMSFNLAGVCRHWRLWNGRMVAAFAPPDTSSEGEQVTIGITVTDVENEVRNGPFGCTFLMEIGEPLHREPNPGGNKGTSKGPDGGKRRAPQLAVPHIVEVPKTNWEEHDPSFTALEALRVRADGAGGHDFYLNIDNSFLLTELSRCKSDDRPLVTYWFKYGLTLCALGMLREYGANSEQRTNGSREENGEDRNGALTPVDHDPIDLVNQSMAGLARVIVPVVRSLYRGPA